MRFSLSLVLGGALGNIVDRLHLGEVVDFFDFGIGDLRWPVFNLADTFVTVGILLLVFAYSRQKKEAVVQDRDESYPGEQIAQE
jgi:signal peptidase II